MNIEESALRRATASTFAQEQEDDEKAWQYLTHKTIFEDHTAESGFQEERLVVALGGKAADLDIQGEEEEEEPNSPRIWGDRGDYKSVCSAAATRGTNSRSSSTGLEPLSSFPSSIGQLQPKWAALPVRDHTPDSYLNLKVVTEGEGLPVVMPSSWSSDRSLPNIDLLADMDDIRVGEDATSSEARKLAGVLLQRASSSSPEAIRGVGVGDAGTKPSSTEALLKRIEELSAENNRLKRLGRRKHETQPKHEVVTFRWQNHYRINADTFLEEPSWVQRDEGRFILKGALVLSNPIAYLEKHKDIAFVAYKAYSYQEKLINPENTTEDDVLRSPKPSSEWVRLFSPKMLAAMKAFLADVPDFATQFPDYDHGLEIPAPYLFWFYCRPFVKQTLESLTSEHSKLIELFKDWAEASYGKEWDFIDSQFAKGLVSPLSMKYLVRAGDVLVTRETSPTASYMSKTWTKPDMKLGAMKQMLQERAEPSKDKPEYAKKDPKGLSLNKLSFGWTVEAWSWGFNGHFWKANKDFDLRLDAASPFATVKVTTLDVYPLRFATGDTKELLKKRGRTFWQCRNRRLVSYTDEQGGEAILDGERYMIDVLTYHRYRRRMQQQLSQRLDGLDDKYVDLSNRGRADGVGPEKMAMEEFPDTPELLVFPPMIKGYDLRRKLWNLEVDYLCAVPWNKKAFDTLAIDEENKELIQALVTNQIAASRATDVIAGKGNGLIMLLHGGPGTGKTFTAESVADFAEKPLYRVTCGDIGIDPVAVENYLESVLHLGRIWDCVVLLDEADVFLEERGQADLQRNALVSVFLRILEYYNGILILTSNRVGTFDEAFKSRIQLSLHYEKLSKPQRRKIWRNFIERLKALGEKNILFDDLYDHLDDLVEHEMNGRQIRNIITTARQLAQYRGKDLCYAHLRHVVGISGKFDAYIKSVKEGFTDEQLARDGGFR